jgi:tricarballylate dehydrogenase
VHFSGVPSRNLFAAGEVSAGNVLGKGYLAGIGVTIGTAFGRIAGTAAARAALAPANPDTTKKAEGALSAAA